MFYFKGFLSITIVLYRMNTFRNSSLKIIMLLTDCSLW